jgi:hypothetical protein
VAAPPPEPPLPTSRERSPERPATELPVDNSALPLSPRLASPELRDTSPDAAVEALVPTRTAPERTASLPPEDTTTSPPASESLAPAVTTTSRPGPKPERPTPTVTAPDRPASESPVSKLISPAIAAALAPVVKLIAPLAP